MKEIDGILERIREGLLEAEQESLFNNLGRDLAKLTDACKDLLRACGYGIREPSYYRNVHIKKLDDLINLFYNLYELHYPSDFAPYKNWAQDRKIAKLFIGARMEAEGVDYNTALKQCADIIQTIFENKEDFNFTIPLTFGILGQKNCGWVTEKALQIMSKLKYKINGAASEAVVAKLEDMSPEEIGWEELYEEDKDGKEKG